MSQFSDGVITLTFSAMRAEPGFRTAGPAVADITRYGVDGHEFIQIGQRGSPFEIVTIYDKDSAANAVAEIKTYEGTWRSKLVTITDDADVTHSRVLILDVHASYHKAAHIVGGVNATGFLIIARWTLQHVGTE